MRTGLLMAIGCLAVLVPGCRESEQLTLAVRHEPRGFVYGRMTGIPQAEFTALPPGDRRRLEYYGSTFQQAADGTVTWLFPLPDRRLTVTFNDSLAVTPAVDAGFELPASPYALKASATGLLIDGQVARKPPPIELVTFPDGTFKVELQYRFEEAGCRRHGPRGGAEIDGVCGSCTACIDNNGLYDYWGCRTPRWLGFPGSDCNAAWLVFGLCGYPNDRFCINGRNCSPLINHPRCWHSW